MNDMIDEDNAGKALKNMSEGFCGLKLLMNHCSRVSFLSYLSANFYASVSTTLLIQARTLSELKIPF